MLNVFIESFDENNGIVTYCLNSATQNPVFHTNETVFILNGKG